MQKKDNKVDNKTDYEEDRQRKKRQKEREINIDVDSPKKSTVLSPHIGLSARAKNKKKLCNYISLVAKYTFFVAKLMFSHSYAD